MAAPETAKWAMAACLGYAGTQALDMVLERVLARVGPGAGEGG
jgi:hypothetical protein